MDNKSQFLYQFREFFVNSNSIPIPFFSIPIPSPIPGIESGIELNSHSIPELTPTLYVTHHNKAQPVLFQKQVQKWYANCQDFPKYSYAHSQKKHKSPHP